MFRLLKLFPSLLRCSWHTALCKFKVYHVMTYIGCEMVTAIGLVNVHHLMWMPLKKKKLFLFSWWELLGSTQIWTFTYSIPCYLQPSCVHYIPKKWLSYNYKLVPFENPHPFSHPPPLPLITRWPQMWPLSWGFFIFRFPIQVRSSGICLSLIYCT